MGGQAGSGQEVSLGDGVGLVTSRKIPSGRTGSVSSERRKLIPLAISRVLFEEGNGCGACICLFRDACD